ncbi:class I adenylate-forming enzyme family protein [Pseudonocardia sp. DLS-67]
MRLSAYLRSQAERQADRDAVICDGARLTFGELDALVDRLAAGLHDAKTGAGDRIAVCLPNGADFVAVFLAACRLGAVTVPVNPRLTDAEIAYMISDSEPRLTVTTASRWATLGGHVNGAVTAVLVDDGSTVDAEPAAAAPLWLHELLRTEPHDLPEVPLDADDCAICYTSGTTGRPKGAVLTQSNYIVAHGFLNGLTWGLGPADRTLITTPMAHRTGLARIVNMVCHGSAVVIMPRFDVAEATRLIAEERVSVLGMVPTVGRMLIDAVEENPSGFADLRIVLGTGEAFPAELAERFEAALPGVRVHAFFAMTEVGQIAALEPADRRTRAGSVGRPVPGMEIKLVDAAGKPAPTGQPGEIMVRDGRPGQFLVMRGYHNRPEATAAVLRDGWFATGDVGRFDTDGFLYIVDRTKDMVVTGGYNVYSREVEDVIRELPQVADAGVVGVPDPRYGESVAAFVQLEPGATLTAEQVVDHCRTRLAGYKKPRSVAFLDAFPRGSTGKLLKRELREMARRAAENPAKS